MSLLDENLVDQEIVDVKFGLMLDELYERLLNGTLTVKDLKKNPLSEYEINDVRWRFVKVGWVVDGRNILSAIGYVISNVIENPNKFEGCSEYANFTDKEYVKEFSNKMLDLYWGKDDYTSYKLEYKIGDRWRDSQVYVSVLMLLTRSKYNIVQMLLDGENEISNKGLLDWIHKWCK